MALGSDSAMMQQNEYTPPPYEAFGHVCTSSTNRLQYILCQNESSRFQDYCVVLKTGFQYPIIPKPQQYFLYLRGH